MFYVAVISNVTTCARYYYSTKSAAMARYHTELAIRDSGRTSTVCIVFGDNGMVIARGQYKQTAQN